MTALALKRAALQLQINAHRQGVGARHEGPGIYQAHMADNKVSAPSADWPAVERRKPGWALDWQSTVERDKARLAKILHDDTGGLLVAAVMDISWAQSRMGCDADEAQRRLARAHTALDAAIEINRRIIEDLRPTLLENFGLAAALKWHFAEVCRTSQVTCEQYLSDAHLIFTSVAAIALYRVAETLLSIVIGHEPRSVSLLLTAGDSHILLTVAGHDIELPFVHDEHDTASAVASVRGRVRSLGGEVRVDELQRGVTLVCQVPAAGVLKAQ